MKKISMLGMLVLACCAFVFMTCIPPDVNDVTNLTIAASTDGAGVVLTWAAPANGADSYTVEFDGAVLLDGITATTYTDANPTKTGTYTVIAVLGGAESGGVDISSEPISVQTIQAWEINGSGSSGIAFNPVTSSVSTYSMANGDYQTNIDFYFTNYATGYAATPYSLASASEVGTDPGINWLPTSGWRDGGISNALTGNIEDGPMAPASGNYYSYTDVTIGDVYAVSTEDNCLGLVQVTSISTSTGQVDFKATLQPIIGFRVFAQ